MIRRVGGGRTFHRARLGGSASIAEDKSLAILDDLVVTRRVLESDMANVSSRLAGLDTMEQLRALVINTARHMGRTERALCVASNLGHRRIYERIAAHDPDGAAEAMFNHITEAWIVRRNGTADPVRLRRWHGPTP
ncbi:FCD domain-containing protein [Nonomuraea sp. NPDC049784]|uniref:FCD domain-containing protein n=1 Tax=Nonomuraea sp. NPDC049784 TaxID=3154361 RepID=UPI0033C5537A